MIALRASFALSVVAGPQPSVRTRQKFCWTLMDGIGWFCPSKSLAAGILMAICLSIGHTLASTFVVFVIRLT